MDAIKSLVQPLVGGSAGSSVVDGMKLVVLGGTVETARRVSSSAWNHFVNSFFLTAHFSEDEFPYDWLMLWLSRRPEWQRSREFETTTHSAGPGGSTTSVTSSSSYSPEDADWDAWEAALNSETEYGYGGNGDGGSGWGGDEEGRPKTRVVFKPTYDTTHTIFYRGHWLRVRRGRKQETGCEMLSISVVARNNAILKQLVLQAKKEYEAEAVHRIQIYFADAHGSWRWTDSRHKRPMASIVLNPGVKEMLLDDARDFLKSEKWYADRGIPFRRGYLLHGVPGSGKSSLIHALAGQLQLDIYVVSLSASWISDNTLTNLMGRVPARCVLLLEDLDAAFVRSTNREEEGPGGGEGGGFCGNGNRDGNNQNGPNSNTGRSSGSGPRRRFGRQDGLSDMNTLSLSGLLNALDGVAASEGRLLFATTNHLERLDPALSRPGRMDVWVEFKNASRWQAEALFRNFFPCDEEDDDMEEKQVRTFVPKEEIVREKDMPLNAQPSLWSLSSSIASSATSLLSGSGSGLTSPSLSGAATPPPPRTYVGLPRSRSVPVSDSTTLDDAPPSTPLTPPPTEPQPLDKTQFGATNTAYLPPPPDPSLRTLTPVLDRKTLADLAKQFADGIPEEEFSVAGLQGYLLKHKAKPHLAASSVSAWVQSELAMRARLQAEQRIREQREKEQYQKRRERQVEKEKRRKEKERKEKEMERVKARLAEREKEEELEKMRETLREKEEGRKKKTKKDEVKDEKADGEKDEKTEKDEQKDEEKDAKSPEKDEKSKAPVDDEDASHSESGSDDEEDTEEEEKKTNADETASESSWDDGDA